MTISQAKATLWIVAIALIGILACTLKPYNFNPSALFHMDETLSNQHTMPSDFVILDVPSYDGAQYYQVSRNIPRLFTESGRGYIAVHSPGYYAYQRFLLPLTAYILAIGQDPLLPWSFLVIQLLSLLGATWLLLREKVHPIFALALALSPAAMIGLHFSLAEPLTILLITLFLIRFTRNEKMDWANVTLASLMVITREVNILFAGLAGVYLLYRKKWKDAFLLFIPLGVFIGLQGTIYSLFGDIPFFESTGKSTFPLQAIGELVSGVYGYNLNSYTSIALLIGFVLPMLAWTVHHFYRRRDTSFLAIGTCAFLLLMLSMPDHIWGSITSIGRVITPVYPLSILLLGKNDTRISRTIACSIMLLGIGAALGLAFTTHPYHLS